MRRVVLSVLVASASLAAACAPAAAKADLAAEEQAIRALDTKWNDLIAKKDLDGIVALYAADGAAVWPDAPAAIGSAAIRAAWTAMLPALASGRIVPERITVATSGDMAFDYGHVELALDTPQGKINEVVKYVVGWKKVDGVWKAAYDVFNSNAPAGPPAPPATNTKGKN